MSETDLTREGILKSTELYYQRRYRDFDDYLNQLPQRHLVTYLREVVGLLHNAQNTNAMTLVRRVGQNPRFQNFISALPIFCQQSIFFINIPQLKTRVSMSFFDHETLKDLEVDYTYVLYNQEGVKLVEKNATILPGQTHTFYIDQILKEANVDAPWGTFNIQQAFPHLTSLRIYAYWYNDAGITTTHEKGTLANQSDLIVYPTIVSDARRETFLVVPNTRDQDVNITCHLHNSKGELYPQALNVSLKPRASAFLPVSAYFPNCREFLAGLPGVAYLSPEPAGAAMYYYFIHDQKKGTWQIQHT